MLITYHQYELIQKKEDNLETNFNSFINFIESNCLLNDEQLLKETVFEMELYIQNIDKLATELESLKQIKR